MALETYNKKRKFDVTSEPRGKVGRAKGNSYLIQKHDASRLHYDFRLELDGVLLSWAVTRGPSLVPGEKRLAIHVEDHPLDYGTFEGTIPQGEYGGGTVMLWDRGKWLPQHDPHVAMKKGHLDFVLDGEKLKGLWHLVRMRKRPGERQEPWLLIKGHDEYERGARDPDILKEAPLSVKTGRDIDEIAGGKGKGGKKVWHSNRAEHDSSGKGKTVTRSPKSRLRAEAANTAETKSSDPRPHPRVRTKGRAKTKGKTSKQKKARDGGLPDFVPPCLATLRERAPAGDVWVHEIKFDGYRLQARLEDGDVRLLTRKALDWADKFPRVAEAVAKLSAETAMLDGEVVVESDKGVSDFSALQNALKEDQNERFVYCVFDLLHLDGEDVTARPLTERKAALKRLIDESPNVASVIRYSEHFEEQGSKVLAEACRLGLEGIVSKRRDAAYLSGRSDIWIKAKCANRQEFVVIGYVPSNAMPKAIGALVVGYHEDGELRYGGRMGTGYTQKVARDLWKDLTPLEVKKASVDVPADERRRDVHWVKPQMVIESEFRGWTGSGLVRQAAFKGVREDKSASEIVREVPTEETDTKKGSKSKLPKSKSAKSKSVKRAQGHAKGAPRSGSTADVKLTHPDRVYWPDAGVTKAQLADYYRMVWDWMAPHIVGRPISLVRCPDGIEGECFFQKHISAGLVGDKLRSIVDVKKRQVIGVEDLDGVLALVQAGVLEIHTRGSTLDHLDLCDRLVFDLDPGEGVTFAQLASAARDVRERLAGVKLESFVKLTGGKGLHVVVPIQGADWETAKTFAQALAQAMEADEPKRYLSRMTKALRDGKIFVDYLRNSLEQTAVAAYSTRSRPGAPVSAPITWEELGRVKSANQYTVLNLRRRLVGLKSDPWADITKTRQKLPNLASRR